MGTIYLKDNRGLTQGFKIDGDTPTASEQARINAALNPQPTPQAPDNPGVLSSLGSGIGAGYYQAKAGLAALGQYADQQTGSNILGYSPEDYDQMRQQAKDTSQQFYAPEGGIEDQPGLGGKTAYLAYQLGQSLPSTVAGTIGAIGGSVLGPEGTVAGFLGGTALAGAGSLPQNYEQNLEEQEQVHGKVTDPGKAFKGAIAQSALEGVAERATLGVAGLAGRAVPQTIKDMISGATQGAFKKAAAKVGETALTGLSTEAATEAVQQGIQRWQADEPLGDEEAQREYLENAIVGGLLGGVTGGAFGTVGAGLDLHERNRVNQIREDLNNEDNYANAAENVEKFPSALERNANAEMAAEQQFSGPHGPLLEDLRAEQPLLSGPNVVERNRGEATSETQGEKAAATPPATQSSPPSSKPQFSEQEYTDAVTAMRGETLVSPDKIKSKMNIGRNKANAIFNAMLDRTDARKSGSRGQYLTVVDNSVSGNVQQETEARTTDENAPKITRRYEAKPIQDEDVAPFQVRRAADAKPLGPSFKTAEDAYAFADAHPNLGDFTVVQNKTPSRYGVYETTSGVPGQKPTSRFVRAFATHQEALDHANGLNPQLSPDTNAIAQFNQAKKATSDRIEQMLGKYQQNVQSLVDQLVGQGKTLVDLVTHIQAPTGEGIHTGNVIEGATSTPMEDGVRRMVIAAGIHDPNLSPDQFQNVINSIAHHEVVHVAKSAGLFTPKEWNALINRSRQKIAGKNYSYLERAQVRTKGAPVGASLHEEAVAEMVRDYMRDPAKFQQQPRSLLRRFIDFVRSFGQAARHISEGNDVLNDFASGKMAGREGKATREEMYGPYFSSVKIPGFYLKSAKYFEKIAEDQPTLAYPGEQWLGMLSPSKTGIKDDELKWLGLKDWLKGQKKVSVRDILEFIASNSIDVQEARGGNDADADFYPVHGGTTQAGGEDYQELIFHMPMLEPQFSVTAHFDGFPNIFAHGRFNTRTIDGKKTLFIEEMQSDLHQQGRKKGYTSQVDLDTIASLKKQMEDAEAEANRLRTAWHASKTDEEAKVNHDLYMKAQEADMAAYRAYHQAMDNASIPEAPFKTNWHEFVVKRLVRHAVETGHDAIAWNAEPEGVAQTEKYGQLDTIQSEENGEQRHFTEWGNDVTGIVNFYVKRLPRDITKLFNKPEFGNAVPHIVPRENPADADLNLEELFPTPDDFHLVMQELGRASAHDPEWAKHYARASQIAFQQRSFDPQRAMERAGLGSRWIDDFNEAFPEYAINETNATMDRNGNPNLERWQMDITPELKATALGEGFSMFSSVQQEGSPDTPEFRRWFGGSKVVGDDGKPLKVYHGTTTDFDRFSRARANVQNDMGAGFYFTDTPEDLNANYAGEGPDLQAKMIRDTEIMHDSDVDTDLDENGIDKSVRASYMQHEGAVIPAYLAIKNPLVLDGKNGTPFDEEHRQKFIDAVRNVGADNFLNVDADKLARDFDYFKPSNASEVVATAKKSGGLLDAIDPETGMFAAPEVIRSALQDMGYDGIIDKDVFRKFRSEGLNENTTHYIAFEANQIKSVNNIGSYNPEDNRFMYSSAQPSYNPNGPMGSRVPQQAPNTTLQNVEANMRYNVIAPIMERLLRGVGKVGLSKNTSQHIAEGTIFAFQDKMIGVGKLVDRVRENGGTISNESDPYLREQLMTGRAEAAIQKANKEIYDPLIHAVQKLDVTADDVNDILKRHPSIIQTMNGIPYEKSAVRNVVMNYQHSPKLALAELYLYAQHAQERNAVMRDRNERLQGLRPDQYDAGSGMTDAEAKNVLDWFRSKPFNNQFADLANPNSIRSLYRKLIANTNDARVAGGLNPDFRTMLDQNGDPVDKYQDYAPLRGWVENNPDHPDDDIEKTFAKIGKRFKIMGKEDQSATGRSSQASNLIANGILQNQAAHVRAEKNLVGQSFLKMIRDNNTLLMSNGPNMAPNQMADFAEVTPLQKSKPVYDKTSGKVRMQSTSLKNEKDMLIVKVNGDEVGIKIHDPRIRAAMLGETMLGSTGQGSLVKGLLKVNRMLAAVRTSYNPEFLISNFFRDMGHAQVNLSEYAMKGLHGAVLKDTLPAIRGVYNALRDTNATNPWRDVFEDFEKHGGKTAFMGTRDLDTTIDRISKHLQTDPDGNWEKAKRVIGYVGELVEAQNDAIENGVRVATYKNLVDRFLADSPNPNDPKEIERAKSRAAFAAKNLTVNFNMGGSQKPLMNALYLFYNASIQGSVSMINPMIRNKTIRRIWLGTVAAGALQDLIMSALSPVAPDGEKEYDKIPDQVLQTNMIFMNPFSQSGYIKIPMPYLFNAAWNSGRAMTRGMRGGYTPGQTMNNVFGTLAESLNPWGGGGSFLNYVAPTILDPLVDLTANTNFMGAPIAPPADPYGHGDIPAQRYWNNTSPVYQNIAWVMDRLTGGDGVFKGAASFSPNQYEYAFEYLGGGAWSTALRAWDFISPEAMGGAGRGYDLLAGNEVSANDIPFVRRFTGNLTSREDLQGYIANRDNVLTVLDKMREAVKNGDAETYQNIIQKYPNEYRIAARVNAYENQRRKIGSQIKKITDNKRLSDEDKKRLVDPLKQRQKDLVNQANAFMNGQQ